MHVLEWNHLPKCYEPITDIVCSTTTHLVVTITSQSHSFGNAQTQNDPPLIFAEGFFIPQGLPVGGGVVQNMSLQVHIPYLTSTN